MRVDDAYEASLQRALAALRDGDIDAAGTIAQQLLRAAPARSPADRAARPATTNVGA